VHYATTHGTYLGSLVDFVQSFGGSFIYWRPESEITFFKPAPEHIKKKVEIQFPQYIYTSKFNYDSLLAVRELIKIVQDEHAPPETKREIELIVIEKMETYTNSIIEEKPLLYYVGSRFMVLKTFFVHSGTYNLFHKASFELNKAALTIKIFYSLLYIFVISFGFVGSILRFFKGFRNSNYLLLSATALYVSMVFPFVFRAC